MKDKIAEVAYNKTKSVYQSAEYYSRFPKFDRITCNDLISELSPIAFFLDSAGRKSLAEFMYRKMNEIFVLYGEAPSFWGDDCRPLL